MMKTITKAIPMTAMIVLTIMKPTSVITAITYKTNKGAVRMLHFLTIPKT